MTQFDVHRNADTASSKTIPYLLDVQSDLLRGLTTRVVVPLARLDVLNKKSAHQLNLIVEIEGKKFVMLTPEMAGIPIKRLGDVVANVEAKRADIIRALDVVFSGV